jgi:hypothetical protein
MEKEVILKMEGLLVRAPYVHPCLGLNTTRRIIPPLLFWEAEEGRLAPMMLSILAKVSVAKSPYRALCAKYSLKGLYFVPSLLGETNLLAQFKHTGTFLSTFFVPSEHDVVSAVSLPHR